MAELNELNECDVAERLVADQSVRELAPLLTVDQRAFVSILATAELYELDTKKMLKGYADETGATHAKEVAAKLTWDVHPVDVAAGAEDIMPLPCKVALTSSRASGTLMAFYRSWLAQTIDDRVNWVRHEYTNVAVLGRLGLRVAFCIWFLSYILMRVIPEHQKMYEEFGVPINSTMFAFLWISNLLAQLFPLFMLVLVCLGLYVICFRRSVFRNYLRRWLPGRWRQIVLPKPILKRKLLAWDLLAFRGDIVDLSNQNTDWDTMVGSRAIGRQEADTLKGVSNMETQAWLLRNMAEQRHQSRKGRFSFAINSLSFLFQVALAVMIVLAAFSIFSMLLKMMEDLA